jgi:hypothetical protein
MRESATQYICGTYILRLCCPIAVLLITFAPSSLYQSLLPAGPRLEPGRRPFFAVALVCQVLLYMSDVVTLIATSKDGLPATIPAYSEVFLLLAVLAQLDGFCNGWKITPWVLHLVS